MKRILFLLMIVATLFAQEVKLDLNVNKEKLYIGDRIKLNYTLSGGERHVFILPDVQIWIKDLEIIDVQTSERVKKHRHFIDLNIEAVKLKYKSWVENNWCDGNDKPIKNWKSKLLNTLPHLKEKVSTGMPKWMDHKITPNG